MNKVLGMEVQDKISGFRGTVTGRCEYITGCTQFLVQPKLKEDGSFVESRWIDEDRVEVLDAPRVVLSIKKQGADKEAPRR
jgi:hypothetical protein